MVLSYNMFYEGFSVIIFFSQTSYFYHKKVVTFLPERSYKTHQVRFIADVEIENYYHHDEEQLDFYKKVHIKNRAKRRMFL